MILFEPTALYTRADLAAALGDTMTVDQFLRKFRPTTIAKSLYYGQALTDAIRNHYDAIRQTRPRLPVEKAFK